MNVRNGTVKSFRPLHRSTSPPFVSHPRESPTLAQNSDIWGVAVVTSQPKGSHGVIALDARVAATRHEHTSFRADGRSASVSMRCLLSSSWERILRRKQRRSATTFAAR